MFDPENRERRWNATFTDYSSHLLPGKLKCCFFFCECWVLERVREAVRLRDGSATFFLFDLICINGHFF